MSLADVQSEIADERAFDNALFQADQACRLIHAIHQITMIRNRPVPEMDEGVLAQRRALLDITLRIIKAELKKVTRELVGALSRWEARG